MSFTFDLLALLFFIFLGTVMLFIGLGLYFVSIVFRLDDDWIEEEKTPSDN